MLVSSRRRQPARRRTSPTRSSSDPKIGVAGEGFTLPEAETSTLSQQML